MMAYNKSPNVVVRNQRYLDEMHQNKRTLRWPSSDPKGLAYRIREALAVARMHEQFTIYHTLHAFFRIRIRAEWVEAEYIGPPPAREQTVVPTVESFPEVMTVQEVVGICISHGVEYEEAHFPAAQLNKEELKILSKWGKGNGWTLIVHDQGITMTQKKVDPLLAWNE